MPPRTLRLRSPEVDVFLVNHGVPGPSTRQPSWAWRVGAAVAGLVALVAVLAGVQFQRQASRPVGEGELFAMESTAARVQMESLRAEGVDASSAVRRIRNGLGVEAVAIIDQNGTIEGSTSPNLVGASIDNAFLLAGLTSFSMAAVAAPVAEPISIDGVVERLPGEIAYHVLQPLEDGGALLLYYDITQLLERRARSQGIQGPTLQLLGLGVFFVVLAVILLIGRSLVKRNFKEMAFEADLLRKQSAELEVHNLELSLAQAEAERALALAEEKNRIRAEFVLMINHELRTPLTTLVTGADLLTHGTSLSDHERRDLLRQMASDGRRLQEMIGQMLAVARIENRGLNFTMQDISVPNLLDDLQRAHPRLAIDRTSIENGNAMWLRTDPTILNQLLSLLIDNAMTHGASQVIVRPVRYLPFVPVYAVGRPPAGGGYLLVDDDGPGIDPAFLPRAFEKFEKDSRSPGTGLGLYIARIMIEALGGGLGIDTSPRGTTMAVAVPLAPARVPVGASR